MRLTRGRALPGTPRVWVPPPALPPYQRGGFRVVVLDGGRQPAAGPTGNYTVLTAARPRPVWLRRLYALRPACSARPVWLRGGHARRPASAAWILLTVHWQEGLGRPATAGGQSGPDPSDRL
jgi:hypothetical protein